MSHLHASKSCGLMRESIKEHLMRDPAAQTIMQLVSEGKTHQFWVEDGLLLTMGNHLLKECHDTPWVGHNG